MSENLEERVKALEDLMQSLARCFVAPPQPKTQTILQPEAVKPKQGVAHGAVAQFPTHLQKYLRAEGSKLYLTEFIHDDDLFAEINGAARDLKYRYVSKANSSDGKPHWEAI